MGPLVTVGIPVYRRLTTLPHALQSVFDQDYPNIELIVSDNGQNGQALVDLVARHYGRPFRVHHHPETVSVAANFNTLVRLAAGAYFVLLCDDDEISPEFVSELVGLLEATPQAALAIPRHEKMHSDRQIFWQSAPGRPARMAGDAFLLAWSQSRYDLVSSTVTQMARTEDVRRCGGYPDLPRALHSDDALWVQLSLGREVVLAQRGAFRWRVDQHSTGHSVPYQQLAQASREYLELIDRSAASRAFAREQPERWRRLRPRLRHAGTKFYYWMWTEHYRTRLSYWEWVRAGFALPPIPRYYKQVFEALLPARAQRRLVDAQQSLKQAAASLRAPDP